MLLILAASAATLSGRVMDEDGVGLSGITVVAYDARLNYATATSTNDGSWSIVGLPGRPYRLRAYPGLGGVWPDRFFPSAWDYCAADVVPVAEDEVRDGLDIVLPLGGTLAGRIVATDGVPLVGAEIVVTGTTDRTALATRAAVSGADGTFVVAGLDSDPDVPEDYRCSVELTGWPDQYFGPTYDDQGTELFPVRLGAPTTVGDWPLLDGISVAGTIFGPDGPVESGTVFLYASSQVISASVQPDGTYLGDGLPPGDVIAWAESPDLATTYYPDADRPSGEVAAPDEGTVLQGVDLTLPAENTLTVQFTGDGDLGEVSVMLYNSEFTVGRGGGLDENGAITIDALHAADYTMFVRGAGGGFTDDWVNEGGVPRTLHVEGDVELTVALPPGTSIEGTVTDEAGAPVYGAYVYALPADDEVDEHAAATDADGFYRIRGVVAGDLLLQASYAWYCPNDPGYVQEYWSDAYLEADATFLAMASGDAITGYDFVLLFDADHDQMGDTWETSAGLDPTRDDAAEDPDGDGFSNYDEWLYGTDPIAADILDKDCGCGKGGAALLLLPLFALRRRQLAASSASSAARSATPARG